MRNRNILAFGICFLLMCSVFIPISLGYNVKSTLFVSEPESIQSSNYEIDWWPMFKHDLYNTGYSTSEVEDNLFKVWTREIGKFGSGSPSVFSNRLYVCGGDTLYCLNSLNGEIIWSTYNRSLGGYSVPAVDNNRVYIGGGKLFRFNALNGNVIWSYDVPKGIVSSPAVYDDKVYFGCHDHKVYCLDAMNGELIWDYTTGDEVWSSPAIYNDKVFISSMDGKLYCLNASSGAVIWRYSTGFVIFGSPAIFDNKVFFGSCNYQMCCLNATNGAVIWRVNIGREIYGSPAIAYNRVYIACYDDWRVFCLNITNGEVIWKYQASKPIQSSPAVADGKVFIGTGKGILSCLDAFNGDVIWTHHVGSIFHSPVIVNGMVFVNSILGALSAFKNDDSPPKCSIVKPSKNHLYICNKEKRISLLNLVFGKINISADAVDDISGIKEVNYYINGVYKGEGVLNPETGFYEWILDETLFGMCTIKVEAVDMVDMFSSDKINVLYFNIRGLCG